MAAVCSGSEEVVGVLLAAGAELHGQVVLSGGLRASALLLAAQLGLEGVARQLVEAGACSPLRGGRWISPKHPATAALAAAAQGGHIPLIDLLYPLVLQGVQGGEQSMVGQLSRLEARHPVAAAAEAGREEAVRKLLALGASPSNCQSRRGGYRGYTPLMLAAAGRHAGVVEQLLAAGARDGGTNERGECAACLAFQAGHLALAQRLVAANEDEKGRDALLASIAAKFQEGFSPGMAPSLRRGPPTPLELVEAHRAACLSLITPLLEGRPQCAAGAPPSLVAKAAAGSAALLRLLLRSGAQVDGAAGAFPGEGSAGSEGRQHGESSGGRGGEGQAGGGGSCTAAPNDWSAFKGEEGSTPLLQAAGLGWRAVERLLQSGADVNQKDAAGTSLLLLVSSHKGLADAVGEQLLRWPGVDLGARDCAGCGPLWWAARRKNTRFGVLLMQRIAEGVGGREGSSVLSAEDAAALLDTLSRSGIKALQDVNDSLPINNTRNTLLLHTIATSSNPRPLRQLLLLPGLDVNAHNPTTGVTPLVAAVRTRKPALVQALLDTGRTRVDADGGCGSCATPLLTAAQRRDPDIMRMLLAAGADPNQRSGAGTTPLMDLAAMGQHRMVQELVAKHGALLDLQDGDGCTAVMHAAMHGHFNTVKTLRMLGADLVVRDNRQQTAHDIALLEGHAEVAVLLRPLQPRRQGGVAGEQAAGEQRGGAAGGNMAAV